MRGSNKDISGKNLQDHTQFITMDSENNLVPDTNILTRPDQHAKDAMNNEVSSTSDRTTISKVSIMPSQDKSVPINYDNRSTNSSTDSPNSPEHLQNSRYPPSDDHTNRRPTSNDVTIVQTNLRNVDLNDAIQVPIVGYEVMEERARFTIFKLKVVDARSDQSWLVFRRYTDFVRLYSRVKAERPNVNLPLPGKRWFRDNFEPVFLEERVRGLQTFVNSIVRRLPNHPLVREFFCLDEPPQTYTYQPEVQAVYGALEDSISCLKTQLKQKDTTILYLQQRVAQLESSVAGCERCTKSDSS